MKTVPLPDDYFFGLSVFDRRDWFEFNLELKYTNGSYYARTQRKNTYKVKEDVVDLADLENTLIEGMDELIKAAGLNIDREKELKRIQKFIDQFNKTQGEDARRGGATDVRDGTQSWIQRWFG